MAHTTFPSDLPVPVDDGACAHLLDTTIPAIPLPTCTDPARTVDLSSLPDLTIVFCYPRTGAPDEVVPESWNQIPGARGCTPQACSFRDNFPEIQRLGVRNVFGLSTQSPDYQKEVHDRLGLPYELLSDADLHFVQAMRLPTFEWEGKKVSRRVTLAVQEGGKIIQVWYPIFPPDKNVADVVAWLKERQQ